MYFYVVFKFLRVLFLVVVECRVKWIDMYYLIICFLCILLLEIKLFDLILVYKVYLLVLV